MEKPDKKKNFFEVSKNLTVVIIFCFLAACKNYPLTQKEKERPTVMMIAGVQHLGSKFTISDFYVDKYPGGPVGKNGGGTGFNCCVTFSRKSATKLTAEIRWQAVDWSAAESKEVGINYKHAVFLGPYVAHVPVEGSDKGGFLFVHFFSGGKVRVVISDYAVNSPKHPISFNDRDDDGLSTEGKKTKEIFSENF